MFHKPLYVREVWRLGWEWWPKDWCTFGWHTVPYDGVVYKALNLGPLSIHNDFIPEADLMALIEGPKAKLIAERETLIAENEAATSWGAAVGARHERIMAINRALSGKGLETSSPPKNTPQTNSESANGRWPTTEGKMK